MHILPLTRRGFMAGAGALPASLATGPGNAGMPPSPNFPRSDLVALCYHEVGLDGPGRHYSISEAQLVQHFNWLRDSGWQAVGIDALLAARDGRRPLPEKAMLLTFDDGYDDFYSRVFPMLLAFNWPGIFALVTSWMETPADGTFNYGGQPWPRSKLMTWAQAREMQASGLCEFACHTHDLHFGVRANPQGNTQPAVVTRIWDPARGYEDDATWQRRVEQDLARNVALMRQRLGRSPRAMVWPYGHYNHATVEMCRKLGMPVTLTLEQEPGRLDRADRIGRLLLMGDPRVGDLASAMRFNERVRDRVMHIDLDYVHDSDTAQQERNLDKLVERVARLGPSTVYLQAFADPDGDGVAEALYFPNRHLPVRADLFNRVSWQLSTRCEVKVFAWMPMLAFATRDDSELVLSVAHGDSPVPERDRYRRLSPFHPRARARIREIYEDLAKHCPCEGLLFHDDGVLSDHEDASPHAIAAYRAAGLPGDIATLRGQALAPWTAFKTQALVQLTQELHQAALRWRAPLLTARNLFAEPVLRPPSEAWYAQSLPAFLAAYDRVGLMAMPYMEGAQDPEAWLRQLYTQVAATPGGIEKTVFEMQTTDWRQRPARPIPSRTIRNWMRQLQRAGAHHLGWYPDDFLNNHPAAAETGDVISARSFPFRP